MEIKYEQLEPYKWEAEVDLHKLYGTAVTGGTLYAYGTTKEEAKINLLRNVTELRFRLAQLHTNS